MAHTQAIVSQFHGLLAKPYGTPALSFGSAAAIGNDTTPFIDVYAWNALGFGSRFSNPASLPPGRIFGLVFSPNADTLLCANSLAPFCSAYHWSIAGFGTKYADPATPPAGDSAAIALRATPTEYQVALVFSPVNGMGVWHFTTAGGWGTKFADPATALPGLGVDIKYNSPVAANQNLGIGHGGGVFISAYPWSDAGFGTKWTDPISSDVAGGTGIRFGHAGNAVYMSHNFSSGACVIGYRWNDATGFGTEYTNASIPGGFIANGIDTSVTDNAVIVSQSSDGTYDKYIAWEIVSGGGFGTRYTALTFGGLSVQQSAINPAMNVVLGTRSGATKMQALNWTDGDGWGTAYSNPGTLPVGLTFSAAFAP